MRHRLRGSGLLVVLLAAVMVVGCRDGGDPLAPEDLTVIRESGSFRLQATGLADVSDIRTWEWEAGAGSQVVTYGPGITGGYAYLTVEDPSGTQVHGRSVSETGTYQTEPGTAGTWTISLFLEGVSGTVDVSVQSP